VARTEEFEELQPLLFAIAYRILGSLAEAEAEDAVQETWLRYESCSTQPTLTKAVLSAVVTRVSIDVLRSARVRREEYVGPWFPEPLLTDPRLGQSTEMQRALGTEPDADRSAGRRRRLVVLGNRRPDRRRPDLLRLTGDRPTGSGLPAVEARIEARATQSELLESIVMCGGLLGRAVSPASPGARSYHPYGTSDPEGFAAMDVVELLVHAHDIARGLNVAWDPPPDGQNSRVLDRLSPDPRKDPRRSAALCTGRAAWGSLWRQTTRR
jgi:hypothetical protein